MWLRSESILLETDKESYETITVGESATNQVVTKPRHPVTGQGSERLRVDIYTGFITETTGITFTVQDSSGYNTWVAKKTNTSWSDEAGEAFTAATTDVCTDTSHGLSTGDVVTLTTDNTLPAGLESGRKYWVETLTANTFYLHSSPQITNATRVDITDTGTGTHSYTIPSVYSITFNPEVSGDQSHVPLRNLIRAAVTSGSSDSLEILDIIVLQED